LFLNDMRYINSRFTYFTYLLTVGGQTEQLVVREHSEQMKLKQLGKKTSENKARCI